MKTLSMLLLFAAALQSASARADSLEQIAIGTIGAGAECIMGGAMAGGAAAIVTLPVKSQVVRDGAFLVGAASGCVLGSVAGYYSAAYGAELPSEAQLNSSEESPE